MTKCKKNIFMLLSLLILTSATAWILFDNANAPYQKMEGKIFGTFYHITYQSSTQYSDEILNELHHVDNSLSAFNPQSIVSHINKNEKIMLDNMFCQVFNLAMQISQETNGAFDVTVAPLVNLWGFGFKNKEQATQEKIDSILQYVGYKGVNISNDKIIKHHPETMLDFSAIAKGYACDVVADLLEKRGISNYMVEIGGEIRAKGKNPNSKQWTLGISKPTEDSTFQHQELQSTLSMPKMAIATSGNYRNFYYEGGQKYAHTIDPHTGRPVQHTLLSATVSASTCAMADAYATAFMVMGLEKAKQFLSQNNEIQAYLIYAGTDGSYKTWCTPTLKKYIDNNN